jgi:hypothetical protein
MRFPQRNLVAIAAGIAATFSAGLALAHGPVERNSRIVLSTSSDYAGTWPVTVTRSQFGNGTGCLTLHSSASGNSATFVFRNQKYQYGSFIVVNGLLMVTIVEPEGSQNGALIFVGRAKTGAIGHGIYQDVVGGSNFDFGSVVFGTKNGC